MLAHLGAWLTVRASLLPTVRGDSGSHPGHSGSHTTRSTSGSSHTSTVAPRPSGRSRSRSTTTHAAYGTTGRSPAEDDPLTVAGFTVPGVTHHAAVLLVPVLVALAAWVALFVGVLVLTRPRHVGGLPASQTLPGDEPPAVVSYVVNRWTVTEDAIESTLLDLAARNHLEFRQLSDDPRATTVHLVDDKARPDDRLTPYEASVLGRVAAVAVGGVAPVTALTFRDEEKAQTWWSAFSDGVVADARQRGLAQRRVSGRATALLTLAALVPAGTVLLVLTADHYLGAGLIFGGMLFFLLTGIAGRPRGLRETPEGREVAARWKGLRRYLQVDEAFQQLPPAAVTVWDRYLAYGDAVGMARVCAAVLDLGLGDRRRVWSSYGGAWRQVRVRYPHAGRTFGKAGSVVVWGAVFAGLFAYLALRLRAFLAEPGATLSVGRTELADTARPVLLAIALVLAARAAYRFARAVVDRFTPLAFEGEVLWVSVASTSGGEDPSPVLHYLAVDDGSGDRTVAWALPSALAGTVTPGDLVDVTARRWTRRVDTVTVKRHRSVDAVLPRTSTRPAPSASAPSGAVPVAQPVAALPDLLAGAAPALAVAGPALLAMLPQQVLAQVATALGADPADVRVRHVEDGATSGVVFDLSRGEQVLPALTMVTARGAQGDLLLTAHRGRGEALPGLGSEAYAGQGWALARDGDVTVRLGVSPHLRETVGPALPGVLASALRALHSDTTVTHTAPPPWGTSPVRG